MVWGSTSKYFRYPERKWRNEADKANNKQEENSSGHCLIIKRIYLYLQPRMRLCRDRKILVPRAGQLVVTRRQPLPVTNDVQREIVCLARCGFERAQNARVEA